MSEVPAGLEEIEIEMRAADRLYDELVDVLELHKGNPKLTTFMVLGTLEALKHAYVQNRIMRRRCSDCEGECD